MLVLENYFPTRPPDYEERIFALLGRLGDAVPAEVELGYHLCYGSPADQHLVMPKDTAILAALARAILTRGEAARGLPPPAGAARAGRRRVLRAPAGPRAAPGLRLYLGLLHHGDGAGDRRRIDVARDAVADFGVATECGWGRGEPARLRGLLESHRHAVDYLVTRR